MNWSILTKNVNSGLFWAKKLLTNQIAQFFKSQYLVNRLSDLAHFSKQVRYPWFLSNKKVFLEAKFVLTPKFAIFDFWDPLNAIFGYFLGFFALFCLNLTKRCKTMGFCEKNTFSLFVVFWGSVQGPFCAKKHRFWL